MTQNFSKKKAFTLIELLIVIAIIGILFIVLVSKVDFATDKAKATGVQTDFRSFQLAFDTVAKENSGFNTFGYNTGDTKRADFSIALAGYSYTNEIKDNGDGIRNSYDAGDINLNGVQDGTETFTGRKVYTEVWTDVYSLVKPGTSVYDRIVLNKLETAINANLDPKLHVTIKDDGEIVMANGAKDPWNKEYHGWYITNAETDGLDRGAIIMYSDGANNEFGSEHAIANGLVSIIVPGNNKNGKDDYSIVSLYTYVNGYGEVQNVTSGFSNNQSLSAPGEHVEIVYLEGHNQTYYTQTPADLSFRSLQPLNEFKEVLLNGRVLDSANYTLTEGSTIVTLHTDFLATLPAQAYNVTIVSENGSATGKFNVVEQSTNALGFTYDVPYLLTEAWGRIGAMFNQDGTMYIAVFESFDQYFLDTTTYKVVDNNICFSYDGVDYVGTPTDEKTIVFPDLGTGEIYTDIVTSEGEYFYVTVFGNASVFVLNKEQTSYNNALTNIRGEDLDFRGTYRDCINVQSITLNYGAKQIGSECFQNCGSLTQVVVPKSVALIESYAFDGCAVLETINFNGTMEEWNSIQKQSNWNANSGINTVICSDGIVTIK